MSLSVNKEKPINRLDEAGLLSPASHPREKHSSGSEYFATFTWLRQQSFAETDTALERATPFAGLGNLTMRRTSRFQSRSDEM